MEDEQQDEGAAEQQQDYEDFVDEAPELLALVQRVVDSRGLDAGAVYERYRNIVSSRRLVTRDLQPYAVGPCGCCWGRLYHVPPAALGADPGL